MAVSGPSFATAAMAMIVEEMPELTIDESSIQDSQSTFPIRDKGKQRAIEIFPEQEELVSPDAECILSEQDQFFESPEEFMDDSLDYGDPNEISFKTDDRYADYEFKTEEHAHQHAVEVLNDHINEINYYDDSRGQYHLVDSHDPIALFRVCKYNISYDDDIINDDAFNHFCKNHYTKHECCSLCRYHDTDGNKTSIHNAFIALGNVLNSSLTSYRACLNNSLNCPCPTCKLKYTGKASWLCDSGASDHFTYDHRDFVEYEPFPIPQEVKTADSTSKIPGQGTVLLNHTLSDGTSHIVKLYPVLYMPSAATGALCKQGYIAIQDEHANIIFKDKRSQSTYLEGFTKPYSVTIPWAEGTIVKTHKNNSTILTKVDNVKIWHKHLGHPDKLVLKQGITHLNGFPNKLSDDSERVCVGCALGKMKSESHPLSNKRASRPLELVHMDLMEMPMLSYHKYRYILMIFNDHTSHIWGGLLRNKSDTIICFEQWYKSQKNLYPKYTIAYVRTDRGGEFMSSKFEELLKNYGIIHQRSTPHIHQQNG